MPSKSIPPLERPPLLHLTVQETLKDYIVTNGLKAGAPLPSESDLAHQLCVGRNSVREAIKSLESLGILETRRGVGVFVAPFSFAPLLDNLAYGLHDELRDVEELRELRRVLETGLIDKTIELISDEDLAQLREVTARMRVRAENNEAFPEEDRWFHQLLFRCQRNQMLSTLLDIFWTAFSKASNVHNLENPHLLDTWKDHHEIVEAIARKDVEQARRRLNEHYSGIQEAIARNRT